MKLSLLGLLLCMSFISCERYTTPYCNDSNAFNIEKIQKFDEIITEDQGKKEEGEMEIKEIDAGKAIYSVTLFEDEGSQHADETHLFRTCVIDNNSYLEVTHPTKANTPAYSLYKVKTVKGKIWQRTKIHVVPFDYSLSLIHI